MSTGSSTKRPFISASITCVTLVVLLLLAWRSFGMPSTYLHEIFLGAVLFCVALITVTVYQSLKISESAHSLAKDMTKDMLLYSRELFSELYRSSPVPYFVIDENGDIESSNFSAVRLFNVEMGALDSLNAFDFFKEDEGDRASLIPEYFKQGKFVNDIEVMVRRPDGVTKWVMLSLFSFRDVKNKQKGLLTLVDITKQKIIDKAKTEFVSLASHQLRTPISGMKWNIELLQTAGKDHLTQLQSTYIEKISHSVERMDMLVNDFLSVSKFELGTLTPTYAPVMLGTFLSSICDEHNSFAERKHIQLVRKWNTDIGSFSSDAHLLHMIVSNLTSNAIKYTDDGGKVLIDATRDSDQITIAITDTGMGIPIEEQERVFSKMFRATNAKSKVTDGTGLGLYIVKGAVLILGGTITFDSKEGQGTTFVARLPIR